MRCLVVGYGASSRIPVGAGRAPGPRQFGCMEALVRLEMGCLVVWPINLDGRVLLD